MNNYNIFASKFEKYNTHIKPVPYASNSFLKFKHIIALPEKKEIA